MKLTSRQVIVRLHLWNGLTELVQEPWNGWQPEPGDGTGGIDGSQPLRVLTFGDGIALEAKRLADINV